eukprot:9449-Heterococcus_DN1.PRE.2
MQVKPQIPSFMQLFTSMDGRLARLTRASGGLKDTRFVWQPEHAEVVQKHYSRARRQQQSTHTHIEIAVRACRALLC